MSLMAGSISLPKYLMAQRFLYHASIALVRT
jgi:hypothetical protein